jgi:hypothetical protein
MIARIWKGTTKASDFETYSEFLKKTAIPDYTRVPGIRGLSFLRRIDSVNAYFTLITYWDSIAAIKGFAGDDYEKAKYYPEDRDFLLDFEENVEHWEQF